MAEPRLPYGWGFYHNPDLVWEAVQAARRAKWRGVPWWNPDEMATIPTTWLQDLYLANHLIEFQAPKDSTA